MNSGKVLVIIGPSGTGKSSVVGKLVDKGVVEITPSWTTRPPRHSESANNFEHQFVSKAEFKRKEEQGYFLDTVELFGLPYEYGMPKVNFETAKVPLIMLRAPLVSLLKKYYPDHIVYQIETPYEEVKKRLETREFLGDKIGSRLDQFNEELDLGRQLADKIFINENIQETSDAIQISIKEDFSS